jgi:hypothetical protein
MRADMPLVLAFDLRCYPAEGSQVPLTVDATLWEQIDRSSREMLRREAALALSRDEASLISPLDMSMLTCLPKHWLTEAVDALEGVAVVAYASNVIGPSRQAYRVAFADGYYGCDICYSDLLSAGWISVGYDVCDDSLSASLLYSGPGGFNRISMECPELGKLINAHGLFASQQVANEFATARGHLLSDHAPFSAVEVLLRTTISAT